ncbi:MAG TPA: hypothetical protein DCP90_03725 [Clostridiales bacterium]|nr:MAG: hypothetical protein A2Y22_06145 [Clostridiales bacterium GWD2_32_59]HAN09704.1 hypothetical protein [Clostridiales bacterium]
MTNYIFLTSEGSTFQPNSESIEPDIENLQVVGIANGIDSREAFMNLKNEKECLSKTSFDEIFCYKLADNYENTRKEYRLKK